MFLRIADGVEGHPQLFGIRPRDGSCPADDDARPLAFSIDLADYESEKRRLESLGVDVATKEFPTFQWRSLFFYDPEGNLIEFVAYDPDVT